MTQIIIKSERSLARRIAGAHNSIPVVVVSGTKAPKLCGESYHYTTKTGLPIYHPNAYSKKGFSSMVYHCSTLRVEVGVRWLDRRHLWSTK